MMTGVYRHYKGGLYQVLGLAQHTEREEMLVVYVSLDGADRPGLRMRARPLRGPDGWLSTVELEGRQVLRFSYRGDTATGEILRF